MKLPKKLIFILILLFSTLVFAKTILAAEEGSGSWYVQPPETWGQKVFKSPQEEVFKERYTLSVLTDIMNSTIAAVGGTTTIVQGPNGPVYVQEGGAANIMANVVTHMTAGPPVSSVEYLAYIGQNLGIAKPAYAQGLGFSAFSPLLTIWQLFRNIAYLFFVIVFVLVGFMIMFRKKIDPRTVVTIQESLPRIVIALILVTFSYALGGLLVDLGGLATRLIGNLLAGNLIAVTTNPHQALEALYQADIFSLVNPLRNVDELVNAIVGADVPLANIPLLGSLTIRLIFVLAGLFIMFKIFFALIGPYISIVLYVIFAPFLLMLEAIPGVQNSFGNWLRNLLANVLVFPVAFAMLALSAAFKSGPLLSKCPLPQSFLGPGTCWYTQEEPFSAMWSPAAIGNWGPAVGQLIGFGILFTIPKVVEIVQQVLQIKPSPLAVVAGEEIRGAAARIPFLGGFLRR